MTGTDTSATGEERWLLPEGIGELLPAQAARVECLRRELLDLYGRWLNSDLPTDLQFMRRAYTRIPNYKPSKAEMKNVASMPMSRVHEFACYDALTTYTVMTEQLKKMSSTNLHVLESIYLPLVFTLNDMTRKGVKVNVNTLALLYARIKPMMDEIEAELFTPVGLNPRSPEQLCNYWNINSTAQMKSNTKGKKPQDFIDYHIRYGHPDVDRII